MPNEKAKGAEQPVPFRPARSRNAIPRQSRDFVFVDETAKGSATPGLMFVDCNKPNGRQSSAVNSRVHRHVMRNYLATSSEPRKTKASHTTKGKPTRTPEPDGESTLLQSIPTALVSAESFCPFESKTDAITISRWYLYARDPQALHKFWFADFINVLWDRARNDELLFGGLALFALRTKAQTTGLMPTDRYLAQQNLVITQLKSVIDTQKKGSPVKSFPWIAVAILATCAHYDGNRDAVGAHLNLVQSMGAIRQMSKEQWLCYVWTDLRRSLQIGQLPVLEYYIPLELEDPSSVLPLNMHLAIDTKAIGYASKCPVLSSFSRKDMEEIFIRLCTMYEGWTVFQQARVPPFGLIYDVEYRLRITHDRVRKLSELDETVAVQCHAVELVQLTILLHSHVASRSWVPQTRAARLFIIRRSIALIRNLRVFNIVDVWNNCGGKAESLLWVLCTITACSLDELAQDETLLPLQTIAESLVRSAIGTADELFHRLMTWPWLDNWHPSKMHALWEALCNGSTGSGFVREQVEYAPLVVGGMEIYQA